MASSTVSRRAVLAVVAAAAALGFVVLAMQVSGTLGPTDLDSSALRNLPDWLTARDRRDFVEYLSYPGRPLAVVLASAVLAALVWQQSRRRGPALFAAVAPITVSVIAELVVKPLVDREAPTGGGQFFPSGHVVGIASVAVAAWLVWVSRWPSRTARMFAAGGLALVVVAVGTSRVVLRNHYATDAVGGALYAVATVAAAAAIFLPDRSPTDGRSNTIAVTPDSSLDDDEDVGAAAGFTSSAELPERRRTR